MQDTEQYKKYIYAEKWKYGGREVGGGGENGGMCKVQNKVKNS